MDKHTDKVDRDGYRRRLALTLSFSQNWDQTMGGLLTIVKPDGTENIVTPQFNCLTLMDVDVCPVHYVSPVETDKNERLTLVGFLCTPVDEED